MKAIGNLPAMGLTAALARALRRHVDEALDRLLLEATTAHGGGQALQRELVDAVRRWAERREEELFPGGKPECSCCGMRSTGVKPAGDEGQLCDGCRTLYAPAVVDEESLPRKEPTNGHGRTVPDEDEGGNGDGR